MAGFLKTASGTIYLASALANGSSTTVLFPGTTKLADWAPCDVTTVELAVGNTIYTNSGITLSVSPSGLTIINNTGAALPALTAMTISAQQRRYDVQVLSQQAYNALTAKDSSSLYFTQGDLGPISRVPAPAAFGWDFNQYPVNVSKDGPRHFATDVDLKSKVTSDIFNGPVFYADAVNGNDANAGTSEATAVQSAWKARLLLEASASPGGIVINKVNSATGIQFLDRRYDFLNQSGSGGQAAFETPSKPMAFISVGGYTYMGNFANLTWTYDATSRTYSATRSAVAQAIDISGLNRFGYFKSITKIAYTTDDTTTRAAVGAAPGSYAINTGTNLVIVRLENDAPVSDATVKLVLNNDALRLGVYDFYADSVGLLGGIANGTFNAISAATRSIVLENIEACFAGTDGGAGKNGFSFDNMTGFVGLRNCRAGSNMADAFNFHVTSGNLHALLIDCDAYDAGHIGSSPATLSCQAYTSHETAKIMKMNCRGRVAAGGLTRNIAFSQEWDLGSIYESDRGDLNRSGGGVVPTGVSIEDNAKYWGDCVTIKGGVQRSFYATANAEIHLRNPIEAAGTVHAGTGLIDTY